MQTIFDPQAARTCAKILDRESGDLHNHTIKIRRSAMDLNQTWQDRKYEPFRKQFEEATQNLVDFLDRAAKYSTYLNELAHRAERYHGQ